MIDDLQIKKNLKKAIRLYLIRPGCNHKGAYNYDEKATKDDGSCEERIVENTVVSKFGDKIDFITLMLTFIALFGALN